MLFKKAELCKICRRQYALDDFGTPPTRRHAFHSFNLVTQGLELDHGIYWLSFVQGNWYWLVCYGCGWCYFRNKQQGGRYFLFLVLVVCIVWLFFPCAEYEDQPDFAIIRGPCFTLYQITIPLPISILIVFIWSVVPNIDEAGGTKYCGCLTVCSRHRLDLHHPRPPPSSSPPSASAPSSWSLQQSSPSPPSSVFTDKISTKNGWSDWPLRKPWEPFFWDRQMLS